MYTRGRTYMKYLFFILALPHLVQGMEDSSIETNIFLISSTEELPQLHEAPWKNLQVNDPSQEPLKAFYRYTCSTCEAYITSLYLGKGRHKADCQYKKWDKEEPTLLYEGKAQCPLFSTCSKEFHKKSSTLGNILRIREALRKHTETVHAAYYVPHRPLTDFDKYLFYRQLDTPRTGESNNEIPKQKTRQKRSTEKPHKKEGNVLKKQKSKK